ncbi:copper amine oxidase N-terminal domain-containing protein, partial [Stenotrophomonas maltophilia]|nr:copper amine oxidase N-terminal domain-containing protein [Stenotrophomonas maltophilia]
VRAISEALGSEVDWDQVTQTVVIKKDGIVVELPLGSTNVKVNGQKKQIDSAAEIKQGRIMVPVRFLSEFLGEEVEWEPNSKMVIIK